MSPDIVHSSASLAIPTPAPQKTAVTLIDDGREWHDQPGYLTGHLNGKALVTLTRNFLPDSLMGQYADNSKHVGVSPATVRTLPPAHDQEEMQFLHGHARHPNRKMKPTSRQLYQVSEKLQAALDALSAEEEQGDQYGRYRKQELSRRSDEEEQGGQYGRYRERESYHHSGPEPGYEGFGPAPGAFGYIPGLRTVVGRAPGESTRRSADTTNEVAWT